MHCSDIAIRGSGIFEKKRFNTTESTIFDKLDLRIQPSLSVLPANLLGDNRRTKEVVFFCQDIGHHRLKIHNETFKSSWNTLVKISVFHCDFTGMDFSFFNHIKNLEHIYILFNANVHLAKWKTVTKLHKLKTMQINYSTGLNEWTAFPDLVNGLKVFFLNDNAIEDIAMSRILQWLKPASHQNLK